jgi:HEAT repeat protein
MAARMRKQLRRMSRYRQKLALTVAKMARQGLPLVTTLFKVMLDPTLDHSDRAAAGRLLAVAGDERAVQALLKLFFEQTDKDDLYATALTLEALKDRRAVPSLIPALLEDSNPHRRHAAARALGWIHWPGSRTTALALARCLADITQPHPAREEAAESLAYVGRRETIEPLISVLHDPDEAPSGGWWSVGKEALAMLSSMRPPVADYQKRLATATQHVLSDGNATAEDRRWAEGYNHGPVQT